MNQLHLIDFLSFQEFAIGKPLNETEYHFYETAVKSLPVILLEFIPGYKGVVSIENGKPKVLRNKSKSKQKGLFKLYRINCIFKARIYNIFPFTVPPVRINYTLE